RLDFTESGHGDQNRPCHRQGGSAAGQADNRGYWPLSAAPKTLRLPLYLWQGEGHQRVQEIFTVMAEQYDLPTEARVQYLMISSACVGRSKIGQEARGTTCWATLPMSIWCARVRPCVPIMIRSTCWSRAVSRI